MRVQYVRDGSRKWQKLTNVDLMNWGCHTSCNSWRSKSNDDALVDETFRNINTDPTTMWKVTTKEQDPTLAYFSIKGVVWVVVGNWSITSAPSFPYWEDHGNSHFQCIWDQLNPGPDWNHVLKAHNMLWWRGMSLKTVAAMMLFHKMGQMVQKS